MKDAKLDKAFALLSKCHSEPNMEQREAMAIDFTMQILMWLLEPVDKPDRAVHDGSQQQAHQP